MGAVAMCAEAPTVCTPQKHLAASSVQVGQIPVANYKVLKQKSCHKPDSFDGIGDNGGIARGPSLSFLAEVYQEIHVSRSLMGQKHMGAAVASQWFLGICGSCDAVGGTRPGSYGAQPPQVSSTMPEELLRNCQHIAAYQLASASSAQDSYEGPVTLLHEALEGCESSGSSTVVLAMLDNTSRIHGSTRSMLAVLSLGDCGLLLLRRQPNLNGAYEEVFSTRKGQKLDVNTSTPRLTRGGLEASLVEETVYFHELMDRGEVRCVSAFEGDLVIAGNSSVIGAIQPGETARICNEFLSNPRWRSSGTAESTSRSATLQELARRIVMVVYGRPAPFEKMLRAPGRAPEDASVVVAELLALETVPKRNVGASRMNRTSGRN
eukprot:TRINITY_DN42813_c0_g1_i1.p1 TRINITY_DN42813_c0_g1~~TRINITY_DN42813_c0_g1_i1.p1  ORF type:complete len:378 (+),score=53.17 TRINITY_DN42813_c0_g1_i1:88-1221(+)